MSDNIKTVEKLQQKTQEYRKEKARPSSPWWRRFSRFRRFFNRRQKRTVAPEAPEVIEDTRKVPSAQDIGGVASVAPDVVVGEIVESKIKSFKRLQDNDSPESRRRRKEELKREKERKKWDELQKEINDVMGNDSELSIAIESPELPAKPRRPTPSPEPEITVKNEANLSTDKPDKKRSKLSEAFRLARLCKRAKKQVDPKILVDGETQTRNQQMSESETMTHHIELADKAVNTTQVKKLSKCMQAGHEPRRFNSIDNVAASLTVDTKQTAVYEKLTVHTNTLNFNDGLEEESFESFRMKEGSEELEYFAKYWEHARVTAHNVTNEDKESVAHFLDANDSIDSSDELDIDDSPLTNIDQQLNSIITLSRCLIQQVERTRREWAKVCQSPVPDCHGLHRGEVLDLIASRVRKESSRRMEMVSYNLQNITKVQELDEDVRFDQECYMRRLKNICDIKPYKRSSTEKRKAKTSLKSRDQAREERQGENDKIDWAHGPNSRN